MVNDRPVYPFVAIVGQERLARALLLNVIDPAVGGVMIMGHRGTAKSTAVRGLAALVPEIDAVANCPYRCRPDGVGACAACRSADDPEATRVPVPVVDLPLGATEDRLVGTLDLEAALVRGEKSFEPGLLAQANRGFLYIDEANLLEDHLVDLLLDVAAAGENVVERESVSVRHPARFVLVGSGNPEEGDLRPQLLDRFGLYVAVTTDSDPSVRAAIVRRRLAFDDDPEAFVAQWAEETAAVRERLGIARSRRGDVELDSPTMERIVRLAAALDTDGHRAELTLARASRAHAAWEGRSRVDDDDVRFVAPLALRHRLRKDPLETRDDEHRLERAIAEHLGSAS